LKLPETKQVSKTDANTLFDTIKVDKRENAL